MDTYEHRSTTSRMRKMAFPRTCLKTKVTETSKAKDFEQRVRSCGFSIELENKRHKTLRTTSKAATQRVRMPVVSAV